MKSVKNYSGRFSSCNFFPMTHLIIQVGVRTRLLWLDNRQVHQINVVVTLFLMIHDLYLLLICHH